MIETSRKYLLRIYLVLIKSFQFKDANSTLLLSTKVNKHSDGFDLKRNIKKLTQANIGKKRCY